MTISMHSQSHVESLAPSDLALLDILSGDDFRSIAVPSKDSITAAVLQPEIPPEDIGIKPKAFIRRDEVMDPLLLAAAFSSGPDVTRNHYAHDFFPGVMLPTQEASYDWTKFIGADSSTVKKAPAGPPRLVYVSRQMSRSERSKSQGISEAGKENGTSTRRHTRRITTAKLLESYDPNAYLIDLPRLVPSAQLIVQCMARTRIPTPYGPVFLHLYHNNRDNKEHLALVVDGKQIDESIEHNLPLIRSQSLDASWGPNETEADRIVRGAYVGRLSPTNVHASHVHSQRSTLSTSPPLIRLHSECFTGETIGSMRCDCGEQLAEALRIISETPTKRGVVVYLRQEGRGIGLLNKIRAYNLQDLGADTVRANELLGFHADERNYEIVGGVLKDLGVHDEVRLLTNNPEKVAALEKAGVRVVERVEMVPRSWLGHDVHDHGVGGILGASAPHGSDLDKYLRTKVEKMGHMLPKLWENA